MIAAGWGDLNPATALVARGDGSLQVFFGGTPPQSRGFESTGMKTAISSDGGRTWSAYQQTGVHFYAWVFPMVATSGRDGRAIVAWPFTSSQLWFGEGEPVDFDPRYLSVWVAVAPMADGAVIAYQSSGARAV